MTHRSNARTLAAGVLLTAVTFASGAHADGVVDVDDALATKVQQEIRLQNVSNENFSGVTVQAKDGVLVLNGVVDDIEAHRAIHDVLKNIDGLHMDQIDDHIVQQ